MVKEISTEEVKSTLDSNENLYLVDTLTANSFAARHIPGARSLPYTPDFARQFEEKIGAPKDAEIVTYCASSGCQLSALAASALEGAGYTNVGHYVDGLAGWQDAGHEFAGETAT